jgi:hypothetical protein
MMQVAHEAKDRRLPCPSCSRRTFARLADETTWPLLLQLVLKGLFPSHHGKASRGGNRQKSRSAGQNGPRIRRISLSCLNAAVTMRFHRFDLTARQRRAKLLQGTFRLNEQFVGARHPLATASTYLGDRRSVYPCRCRCHQELRTEKYRSRSM